MFYATSFMIILAIDPGYDRLGIAILEKKSGKEILLHSECFSPEKNKAEEKRIFLIGEKIGKIITKYKPEALALESLFFNKNQKTALLVAETRGVIMYEASRSKMSIKQFTPLQVKIAITGYGRSEKKQVSEMVKKLIEIEKEGKILDDEYDAIAIGLTYFASVRI